MTQFQAIEIISEGWLASQGMLFEVSFDWVFTHSQGGGTDVAGCCC